MANFLQTIGTLPAFDAFMSSLYDLTSVCWLIGYT